MASGARLECSVGAGRPDAAVLAGDAPWLQVYLGCAVRAEHCCAHSQHEVCVCELCLCIPALHEPGVFLQASHVSLIVTAPFSMQEFRFP